MTREQRDTVCLSIGAMDMAAAILAGAPEMDVARHTLNCYGEELRQMLNDDRPAPAMEPEQGAKLAALRDALQESLNTIRWTANFLRGDRPSLARELDDAVGNLAAALEDSAQ